MPRDGSGNYTLPSGNPVVSGTVISSSGWGNPTMSDIAAALTQSLSRDGQTTPTANLPMGNFRHINVAAAVSRTDYAQAAQVQDSAMTWLTSVSGTDTIVASAVTPSGLAAYAAGQQFRFVSAGANTTSAVTLNINGLGAKNVTQLGASTLQPGMIQSGAVVTVTYDGTQFQAIGINNGANVVGTARNAKMVVSAASNTGTFTATEIIVETVLGGVTNKLSSYSQTINVSTTGAGGMDTGLAPVSGYVAIYAIYNSTTGTASILAQTVSGVMPEVYGGANMPSGYTSSALIALWPTTAGRQLGQGALKDRKFFFSTTALALSSSTAQGSLQTLSISSIVPPNANEIVGDTAVFTNTAGALAVINLFGSSFGASQTGFQSCAGATGAAQKVQWRIALFTAQTMYYTSSVSGGTFTYTISIEGFDF